jgi:CheY-like chemotaxis protein
MAATLEECGITIIQAGDGETALTLLNDGCQFDLLISDLSLPGRSGDEIIRAVQAKRGPLPAILVTGSIGDMREIDLGMNTSILRKTVLA